ncbi:Uncharacterised protein [Acinetobacter baumannii]|jgi:hypothetical protein|nr:Uncharacterised protein [Acinetobacter baumannii]
MILTANALIHHEYVLRAQRQDHGGAQGKALQEDG